MFSDCWYTHLVLLSALDLSLGSDILDPGWMEQVNTTSVFVWDFSILFVSLPHIHHIVLTACSHGLRSVSVTPAWYSFVTVLRLANHSCNLRERKTTEQEGLSKGEATIRPCSAWSPGAAGTTCTGSIGPLGIKHRITESEFPWYGHHRPATLQMVFICSPRNLYKTACEQCPKMCLINPEMRLEIIKQDWIVNK